MKQQIFFKFDPYEERRIIFLLFHVLLFIFFIGLCSRPVPLPLQGNLSNFDLIMESDMGTFTPVALQFSGSDAAKKVLMTVDDLAGKNPK